MKPTIASFITLLFLYNISAAQNVGVGTTTPPVKLTVQDASASNLLLLSNFNAMNTNVRSTLLFGGPDYVSGQIGTIGTSNVTARLGFLTGYSVTGVVNNFVERLSILNNGYIGINQTNPQYLLDVNGNASYNGNIRVTGRNSIEFGADLTKEVNAGKIGYGTITPGELDIVGGGTTSTNRIMKFWNEGGATFSGGIYMESGKLMNANSGAANLLPYAYGTIAANGTILNGTGNFTVTKFGTGAYEIFLANGQSYDDAIFTSSVTAQDNTGSTHFITCYEGGPETPAGLAVVTKFADGHYSDTQFSFFIYKPY
ncbi:hypothetical protein [Ferruginibacter albus]|uniref:hypothetical protein n=1 Tax=Ferruginibacter albus TaxID=2875540 RepID=UPI001CC6FE77|nr:hypothetical protein [Ferruginibacter albus]UAY53465.1 hypothetical protein K9M53_07265 [Ferruginibacter albus]